MDVLSDTLAALRTGRPYSTLTRQQGHWETDIPPFGGAGFHVVLDGSCRLIPRAPGEAVTLVKGDAVFLPHGTPHTLTASADRPSTVLLTGGYRMDQARAHPLLADFPAFLPLPARATPHASLHTVIRLLGDELESPGQGTDAALPSLLELLLIHLMRAVYEARSTVATTGWCRALADPTAGAALRALHTEPARPWTVASLAATAGLSRAAFSRRFTTLVGRPPLTYATWWRLTLAAGLLRNSDATLATVAERVGYGSQFAFANAFKREYGTSPGRYRLLTAGDDGSYRATTVPLPMEPARVLMPS
ncbi:AraC family transcriptional regulator [Streptomyces abikoensis]|uniref:AraC family transcriptional regulator n=1 Tax=Streptomyces abikoensis TaxID=97398 RepID=UPI001671BFD3|nr:AraC family transcriptional regulator [Streptomyces abikoensis]GGP59819.1 AraC family transcriptional regulator [Streptomyces abikoensis]